VDARGDVDINVYVCRWFERYPVRGYVFCGLYACLCSGRRRLSYEYVGKDYALPRVVFVVCAEETAFSHFHAGEKFGGAVNVT